MSSKSGSAPTAVEGLGRQSPPSSTTKQSATTTEEHKSVSSDEGKENDNNTARPAAASSALPKVKASLDDGAAPNATSDATSYHTAPVVDNGTLDNVTTPKSGGKHNVKDSYGEPSKQDLKDNDSPEETDEPPAPQGPRQDSIPGLEVVIDSEEGEEVPAEQVGPRPSNPFSFLMNPSASANQNERPADGEPLDQDNSKKAKVTTATPKRSVFKKPAPVPLSLLAETIGLIKRSQKARLSTSASGSSAQASRSKHAVKRTRIKTGPPATSVSTSSIQTPVAEAAGKRHLQMVHAPFRASHRWKLRPFARAE